MIGNSRYRVSPACLVVAAAVPVTSVDAAVITAKAMVCSCRVWQLQHHHQPHTQLAAACNPQPVLLLLLLLPAALLVLQATTPAVPHKQQHFKVHGVRQGHLVVSHT